MKLAATLLLLAVVLPHLAYAADNLEGSAFVIDGDTIDIRLHGTRQNRHSAIPRMGISTLAASMHHGRSASGSAANQSAAFAAILTAMGRMVALCTQSKASTSADGWSSRGRRSPSEDTRSTMLPMRTAPGQKRSASGRASSKIRPSFGISLGALQDHGLLNRRYMLEKIDDVNEVKIRFSDLTPLGQKFVMSQAPERWLGSFDRPQSKKKHSDTTYLSKQLTKLTE